METHTFNQQADRKSTPFKHPPRGGANISSFSSLESSWPQADPYTQQLSFLLLRPKPKHSFIPQVFSTILTLSQAQVLWSSELPEGTVFAAFSSHAQPQGGHSSWGKFQRRSYLASLFLRLSPLATHQVLWAYRGWVCVCVWVGVDRLQYCFP